MLPHAIRAGFRLPPLLVLPFIFVTHAAAATLTWQGDLGANWSAGTAGTDTNWSTNTQPASGDNLTFNLNGVTTFATVNNLTSFTSGTITFTNDTGTNTGFTLSGNAITLGGNITSSGTTGTHPHTLQLDLILNATRTVTAANNTTIVISGNISESVAGSGFIKAGGEQVTLSGSSSFTGAVSVNQGVLSVSSIASSGTSSAIGAGSVINFGSGNQNGTLFYSGAAASTNRTINLASASNGGAIIDASGTGALTLTGNVTNVAAAGSSKTLTLNGTATGNEFAGVISDGGNGGVVAVSKGDTGTWTLSALNTFTGALSVLRASLTINSIADTGTASAIGSGSTINLGNGAQPGTLIYTGTGGNTNRALVLAATGIGGGTITNNGTGALLFTGTFSNAGTSASAKTFTLNGSNTGANEVQAVLVDSAGGALSVVKSGAGSWTLSGASSFTGALSVNQGVLTVTSIAASGINSAIGAGSTINFGSAVQTGTLNYTGTGATTNRAIVLASTTTGGATINNNGTGALIFTGVLSTTGTGTKTMTLGGGNTGSNELASVIADGSGLLGVTKADSGTWILSGANTYSNGTTLGAGTLVLNSASAIGTGTLTITGGALDNTSGAALTLSTGNAVALNGSLVFNGTNSLNLGGGVVTIGNANRDITLNGGSTLTLGEVQWNNAANNRTLTVNQGTGSGGTLVLGGFQLNVNADTAARNRIFTGTGNVTISGVVSNGNGFDNGVIYSGSGTLTLSAANTYTGTTTVNGGILKLTGAGSIATSSSLAVNAGTFDVGGTAATGGGALTLGSATTTVAGQTASFISSTSGGSFTLGGNVTYNAGTAGFENGQATISADLVLNADRTITVNDSPIAAVDVLVSGVISGGFGLTKGNGGTLRLSGANTYTGQTLLNNGVTEVYALGNTGVAGSLGTADKDATAGIIRFGNAANTATLSYLGTGDSTNRRIQIGSGTGATATGGATILSNGSGALIFTAATFNSAVTVSATGASTARVLTLGGSSTAANTIQGAIINNTGAGTSGTNAVAVVKQDAGVWILSGASTYSGGTTVSGGTLLANNTTGSATGTGSVSISSGGSLGGSGTAGSLSAEAAFTQQSGGVVFVGQNGVQDAQTLTLQAAAGFSLSGAIVLDLIGGGASGTLNAQSGNNDLLIFSGGAVTLTGATLNIRTTLPATAGTWTAGSTWHLIDWTAASITFDSVSGLPDLNALGLAWDLSGLYTSGTVGVVLAAPEPARGLLLMAGLSVPLLRRRRVFKS